LAPYLENKTSFSYFCDPTKVKEYLACGLPVIITRVPWIWQKIEKKPMGLAIDYQKQALKDAILKLLSDSELHSLCRKNGLHFSKNLDWDNIFLKAFKLSNRS